MAAGVKLLSLPVEDVIIPHILSRLSPLQVWSLRLVSSQFYAIVYQYYATNCQDINFTKLNGAGHHDIKDDQKGSLPVVCRILAHCYRLRDLRLNGEYFQSVDNEDIKMGDTLLLSLNKTKPNLTVLQLEFLYLSRATLHLLKECCNYLKILILVGLQELELYDIISEEHSSLEELRLVDCSFPSNQLQKILMKQTELEIFQLSECSGDIKLESIIPSLSSLHTLSLSHSSYVSDQLLLLATEYCPLRNLEVLYCPLVTYKGLNTLQERGVSVVSNILLPRVVPTSSISLNQI